MQTGHFPLGSGDRQEKVGFLWLRNKLCSKLVTREGKKKQPRQKRKTKNLKLKKNVFSFQPLMINLGRGASALALFLGNIFCFVVVIDILKRIACTLQCTGAGDCRQYSRSSSHCPKGSDSNCLASISQNVHQLMGRPICSGSDSCPLCLTVAALSAANKRKQTTGKSSVCLEN